MTDRPIPAHVRPYVAALGEEGAVRFFLSLGGALAYLSENPQSNSQVVRLVGRDGAVALARQVGAGPVRVPTAKPFIAAHFEAKGENRQQIARRLHVSDVTVRRWLNRDPDQLRLFG